MKRFWMAWISGFSLGAGIALVTALLLMFKFAHELVTLFG